MRLRIVYKDNLGMPFLYCVEKEVRGKIFTKWEVINYYQSEKEAEEAVKRILTENKKFPRYFEDVPTGTN